MRKAAAHREGTGEFPSFEEFVDFVAQEDKIAHDSLARTVQKAEDNQGEKKRYVICFWWPK